MTGAGEREYHELQRLRELRQISAEEFIEKARLIPGTIWYEVDAVVEAIKRERAYIESRLDGE